MKHLLTLTLLCFGLLAQAQIPSYVPTNGLVGWWPFNGNANDESGNGNHGTVNGATLAADRFGNAGKAYSFDGVNDNISIAHNQTFNFSVGFTVSIWIKIEQLGPNNQWFIDKSFDPTTYHWGLGMTGLGEVSNVFLTSNGAFGGNANYNLSIAEWVMLCMTYDGSKVEILADGISVWSTSASGNMAVNSLPIQIGNFPHTNMPPYGYFFNGKIDDIAIYNRALSAAEVQQLYLGCQTQPSFTAQPQNKSVAQGQTTTFAVQVDSASRYQWQMNLGLGAGWTNIPASALFSGDTTATLTVEGRNPLDGARFRCIATSCNADTSNAATLTVTSSATAALGTVAGVPGLINYQGSALDSAGKPLKNQTISLKLSVLDSSSTGAAVYVESHSAATNGSGHFAIQIGGGTALLGTFDSVGWANGRNKYLKTELSQNGTWVNLGTSQLVSVPYALHAGSAQTATTLRDSAGNVFSVGYSNGQPTLVPAPGSGSASNPGSFACGQSVTYAGESYPTVQIGTQCWFQKNLNVGTMIQGANDQTNNSVLEKYCYNNDTANCSIYGGLYQWAEAVQYQNGASNTTSPSPAFSGNVKGICPTGWHVPSDGEYCTITTFLDASVNCSTFAWSGVDVGGKMKSTCSLWNNPNIGATNNSGFSSLPGGYRSAFGSFENEIDYATFWSNTMNSSSDAIIRFFLYNNSNIYRFNYNKGNGFSVRCLKD